MTTAVVSVSGGLSSFYTLRYAAEQYDHLHGVFADVRFEDPDTYHVVWMAGEFLAERGESFTVLCDGRNPFELFHDRNMLGGSQRDPCSEDLKRKPIRRWLKANFDPGEIVVAIGFDVDEGHRIERCQDFYKPFTVASPLADADVFGDTLPDRFLAEFGWLPWAYVHGMPHSNCYGMCVKAGIEQWLTLLQLRPAVYAYAEAEEEKFRAEHGNVSILRDRSADLLGNDFHPLPLRELREKAQDQATISALIAADDGGACSCFDPPITNVKIGQRR